MTDRNLPLDEELLAVAAHWCDELNRLGADFAQVFVEAGTDLRVETRLGPWPEQDAAASVTRRFGAGVLFRHRDAWRYCAAPLTEPGALAERIRALTGTRPRTPASVVDDDPRPTHAGAAVRPLAGFGPVDADVRVSFVQDFFRRHRAVADSAGTRHTGSTTAGRQRATASLAAGTSPVRAFTRRNSAAWDPAAAGAPLRESAADLVHAAVRQARGLVGARSLGDRTTPVVFGPKAGAALLHELIGHALEADNLGRNSDYAARILRGRLTPAPLNLLDDPTVPDGMGTMRVDDDGHACEPAALVCQGEPAAALSGLRWEPDAAVAAVRRGRRQDYRHHSLPRASNTCVAAGGDSVAALLQPAPGGLLYVSALGSGEFNPARGEFSFAASSATFVTPDGNTQPVYDVNLSGDALSALGQLSGIADDVDGDNVTCGKQGQAILIGLYSPTMRFDRLDWRC
jgi:predicted Zn-dependent protease